MFIPLLQVCSLLTTAIVSSTVTVTSGAYAIANAGITGTRKQQERCLATLLLVVLRMLSMSRPGLGLTLHLPLRMIQQPLIISMFSD